MSITVTWSDEDAAIVHALLSTAISTNHNHVRAAVLRGDFEHATKLAREGEHLQHNIRGELRGAAMQQRGTHTGLEIVEGR